MFVGSEVEAEETKLIRLSRLKAYRT
jgi:hypothetical protein